MAGERACGGPWISMMYHDGHMWLWKVRGGARRATLAQEGAIAHQRYWYDQGKVAGKKVNSYLLIHNGPCR